MDTWRVPTAVDVTLLGRYYERFADHAVEIARRVIYQATGATEIPTKLHAARPRRVRPVPERRQRGTVRAYTPADPSSPGPEYPRHSGPITLTQPSERTPNY